MCFTLISGSLSKDAYEFLIAWGDKLRNLSRVETCGIDYTIFQLELAADILGEVIWILD